MWNMTSDRPAAGRDAIALLHRVWDARAAGDLGVLEAALAPEAKWRAIDDGPFPPWPGPAKDAILQPPKPEIRPCPQVLERAADRDADWEAAD